MSSYRKYKNKNYLMMRSIQPKDIKILKPGNREAMNKDRVCVW